MKVGRKSVKGKYPPCPKCQSGDTRKAGIRILSGQKKQQYQCKNCGICFIVD